MMRVMVHNEWKVALIISFGRASACIDQSINVNARCARVLAASTAMELLTIRGMISLIRNEEWICHHQPGKQRLATASSQEAAE